MDRFETDVMDDLMNDAAEGPAQSMDELDEDGGDAWDEGETDDSDDEFLGQLAGGLGRLLGGGGGGGRGRRRGGGGGGGLPGGLGNILGGLLGADEGDEWDGGDEGDALDEGDELDEVDALDEGDEGDEDAADDLVADALEADDSDEFLRRLGGIARRVGRGIGSVARTVAPIASMIPLPQAQLIGRIAGAAGRLLADGADEFEAIDELVESMDEEEVDAAAPVIAGLALRRALPAVARLARGQRRRIVRSVAQTARAAVRRAGPRAARVAPRVVAAVRGAVRRRAVPARRIPQVVRRIGAAVVRRPAAMRRVAARPLVPPPRRAIARPTATAVVRRAVAPVTAAVRRAGGTVRGTAPGGCARCGRMRQLRLRGPVSITIHSR
jgi:hypothetical protein